MAGTITSNFFTLPYQVLGAETLRKFEEYGFGSLHEGMQVFWEKKEH